MCDDGVDGMRGLILDDHWTQRTIYFLLLKPFINYEAIRAKLLVFMWIVHPFSAKYEAFVEFSRFLYIKRLL